MRQLVVRLVLKLELLQCRDGGHDAHDVEGLPASITDAIMRDVVLALDVDTNAQVLEVLDARSLERRRKWLGLDAVGHAHRVSGEELGVVVHLIEGTLAKLVLEARAQLAEPSALEDAGEDRLELLRARRVQRVGHVDGGLPVRHGLVGRR